MNILFFHRSFSGKNEGGIVTFINNFSYLKKKSNIKLFYLDDKKINKYCKKEIESLFLKIDIVHLNGPWNLNNSFIIKLCKYYSIPYIFSLHGMLDKWSLKKNFLLKKIYFLFFLKKQIKGAAAIHYMNQEEFILLKNLNVKNIFLIKNYINPSKYTLKYKKKTNKHKIKLLYLGRITEKKNLDLIIDAIKILNNKYEVSLDVIGSAHINELNYLHKLKEKIKFYSLKEKIFFRGHINSEKRKSHFFNSADFFILPSSQEGDSLSLKEALLHNIRILCTKECNFNYPINTLIIKKSATSIANTLIKFIKLKHKKRPNCKKFFLKKFNESMNEFENLYLDINLDSKSSKAWYKK
jgi:glycosyltransferase involved in cell wall biosynthesis